MNKLVINTANDKLFIVLQYKNNIFSISNNSKMHHNETMLPLIDGLLKKKGLDISQIDEMGVVVGPGSFTGIRVGISTVKAFRDVLKIKTKGINNLDYLFALAKKKYQDVETVAIRGGKDSYFVAKFINNKLYKYERNLTKEELLEVASGGIIAVFGEEGDSNFVAVEDDAQTLLNVLEDSIDENLIPVYYQLSQAENEKFKRCKFLIDTATKDDLQEILQIEKNSILVNTLTENDILTALTDNNYKTFKMLANGELVGFIILQITDELNILSIAVKKEYRNLGLASKLILETEEFAKDKQIKTISLEVNYNNVTAFLLYQKLGFKLRRVRKGYYEDGGDCLEMIKEIIHL